MEQDDEWLSGRRDISEESVSPLLVTPILVPAPATMTSATTAESFVTKHRVQGLLHVIDTAHAG